MLLRKPASRLYACGASTTGKVRLNNEDNFYVNGLFPSPSQIADISADIVIECPPVSAAEGLVCAVFDGMGGESCGELASETAVKTLAENCAGKIDPAAVQGLLEKINDAVLNEAKARFLQRCGTTAAITIVDSSGSLYAVNVGDSRIYLMRKNSLTQLTRDDTQAQMYYEASMIKKSEIKNSPMRNVLTQYIGMDRTENPLNVHIRHSVRLTDGDRILICSDGVTDMLSDDAVRKIMGSKADARSLALSVIHAAVEAGGKDNATAVIIDAVQE